MTCFSQSIYSRPTIRKNTGDEIDPANIFVLYLQTVSHVISHICHRETLGSILGTTNRKKEIGARRRICERDLHRTTHPIARYPSINSPKKAPVTRRGVSSEISNPAAMSSVPSHQRHTANNALQRINHHRMVSLCSVHDAWELSQYVTYHSGWDFWPGHLEGACAVGGCVVFNPCYPCH